jgi:FkbM family methyltransferase
MQNKSFVSNVINGVNGRIRKIFKNEYKKASLTWLKVKNLKHLQTGPEREFNLHGQSVYFTHPQDLLHGLREIFIDEVYKIDLPPKPYIIDCGSNIGLSIIYLKNRHPDAEIVGFEPDRSNFALLKKNIESNKLQGVTLLEKAAWISDDVLDFSNDGDMGSKIEIKNDVNSSTKVQGARLRDYIDKQLDFLKIDIEGAEYEVLKDISDKLGMVRNMFVEYHGSFSSNNELIDLLTIIQRAGFKLYIKEAANVYNNPFQYKHEQTNRIYDVQLNIFCFRT